MGVMVMMVVDSHVSLSKDPVAGKIEGCVSALPSKTPVVVCATTLASLRKQRTIAGLVRILDIACGKLEGVQEEPYRLRVPTTHSGHGKACLDWSVTTLYTALRSALRMSGLGRDMPISSCSVKSCSLWAIRGAVHACRTPSGWK